MLKKLFSIILITLSFFGLHQVISSFMQTSKYDPSTTKVIIIGATSGIGQATAKEFVRRGFTVGITGRRTQKLHEMQSEAANKLYIQTMDISKPEQAQQLLLDLIHQMGGVDIILINAGTGNTDLAWPQQKMILDVNVIGFAAMASAATDYFLTQGKGHICGVSSIAGLRGISSAPVYSASKAFVSNYLDGLRARFKKNGIPIVVTEIQPGLVGSNIPDQNSDWSAMDPGLNKASQFMRASPEKAAVQICNALEMQREHEYVTKRWQLIAWIFKVSPDFLFNKMV